VDLAYKSIAVTDADAYFELLVPLLLPRIAGVELRLLKVKARFGCRDGRAEREGQAGTVLGRSK